MLAACTHARRALVPAVLALTGFWPAARPAQRGLRGLGLSSPGALVAPWDTRASGRRSTQLAARGKARDRGKGTAGISRFLQSVAPRLDGSSHKGQGGRIGVLGGSAEFTGAPFYAGMAALRTGAELVYVYTAEEAAVALKSYSPELMVTSVYSGEADVDRIIASVAKDFGRLHALVIGPGLGRRPNVLKAAGMIMRLARAEGIPVIVDADGLQAVMDEPDAVFGHPLAVLTPNVAEYRRLLTALGEDVATWEGREGEGLVWLSQALGGVTFCLKGGIDTIAGPAPIRVCTEPGTPRRSGGLGDILAGGLSTVMAWLRLDGESEGPVEDRVADAAEAACILVRRSSRAAFRRRRRAMTAPDVLDELGDAFEDLCPAEGMLR